MVNGPLIPVNYLMELGLFFLVGTIQWRKFRRRGRPLSRQELACTTMIATSILICTFLRSSVIGCNDLGWRGFLLAEFMLLLWAVDIVSERKTPGFLSRRQQHILAAFLILGGWYGVRSGPDPLVSDAGRPRHGAAAGLDVPDRQFGKRTYASRSAYAWTQGMTPETAIIQSNPRVVFQDTPAMLYADRRTVAADTAATRPSAATRDSARPLSRASTNLSGGGQPRLRTARRLSQSAHRPDRRQGYRRGLERSGELGLEAKPVFANRYVRLFSCGDGGGILKAAK